MCAIRANSYFIMSSPIRNRIKRILLPALPSSLTLLLKQIEVVLRTAILRRYYEPEERVLLDLLRHRERGVVLDVGANLGQYALAFARVPQCSQVICIEPQARVARMLRAVARLLQTKEIVVVQALAGDTCDNAYVHTPIRDGCVVGQETYMVDTQPDAMSLSIPVVTLDGLISDSLSAEERVILIKIDVEGAELRVLRGANEIIRTHRPILMVELVDDFLSRYGSSFPEVEDWLVERGYVGCLLRDDALVKMETGGDRRSDTNNYVFLPASDHWAVQPEEDIGSGSRRRWEEPTSNVQ